MKYISYKNLTFFTTEVLKKTGLDKFSRDSVALGLCETSLRGVDSHGIRLLPHYIDSALKGRKNPKPNFKFFKKYNALATLDADNAFGHSAGMKAIDYCLKLADKNGLGLVLVKNSSHPGAMASMALRASRKGYACFAFTHADSLMLAFNGIDSLFGTNPFCFSCPSGKKEPYCLDMATTLISWNKLLTYKKNNKKLKNDMAADKFGNQTLDPKKANSLFPAGGYKGFALASMIEILCGVMTGMPFGRSLLPMFTSPMNKKRHLGQFYLVFKIDGAISKNQYIKQMKLYSNMIRSQKSKTKNKVMMPNDPEIQNSKTRLKNGIPLSKEMYTALIKISKKTGVNLKIVK
jgi:ureidoglycolate dehydrogenase (NAD+)